MTKGTHHKQCLAWSMERGFKLMSMENTIKYVNNMHRKNLATIYYKKTKKNKTISDVS